MQTKSLKAEVPDTRPLHTEDDARWMRKVIDQEHIKPLEVNKDYVLEYERREKENAERLTTQVERHISTLAILREKLETRHDLKSRTDEYRAWQRDFTKKKDAVLIGKTLQEIEAEGLLSRQQTRENSSPQTSEHGGGRGRASSSNNNNNNNRGETGGSTELSNVLESLNKLAELEKRITSLEKDNAFEHILQSEKPGANERTLQEFKKKRSSLDDGGPLAVVYAMRPKKASWQVQVPAKKGVGGGAAAVRAKQQQQQQHQQRGGVFLTEDGGEEGGEMGPEERRCALLALTCFNSILTLIFKSYFTIFLFPSPIMVIGKHYGVSGKSSWHWQLRVRRILKEGYSKRRAGPRSSWLATRSTMMPSKSSIGGEMTSKFRSALREL